MALVLFVTGTLILTAFVAWATHRSAELLRQGEVDFNLLLLPVENLVRIGLIVACLVLAWVSGLPWEQFGLTSTNLAADAAIGLALGLVLHGLLNALTNWALRRFGPHIYSPVVILSILPDSRTEWVAVLLALFPAVMVEELLFRSLLLGGLAVWLPMLPLAIGTAILFGWMHSPQGQLAVVLTAAVSLVLSGLFLWRGSLLPCLVAHYGVNLLQLVVAYRQRDRLMVVDKSGQVNYTE